MSVNRGQPWDAPNPAAEAARIAAEQAYNHMINVLQQERRNQEQAIFNQISGQNADMSLAGLQTNLLGDQMRQQMARYGMMGDLGALKMQQQRAANNAKLNVAETRFSQEQRRLGMADDILQRQYQRANNRVPSLTERAQQIIGY